MSKIELAGYLYIRENGYDQYYVDEVYLDEDTSGIFYKELSEKDNRSNFLPRTHPNYNPDEVKVKEGKLFADVLKEKLGLKSSSSEYKSIRDDNDVWVDGLHTFMPDNRRVKITIEVLENED
jgi:hypothetical protein